ncbi:MAG: NAD(P)/FAD-dependent oxidoreductase [Treponema sp.]|nr:NAD(P)/FAD-dependent oxidoreductase [Treponema sp.]
MPAISRLNKKLHEAFGGKVRAELAGGVLRLTGELADWKEVVRAGRMSVNRKKYGLINDIVFTGASIPPMKMPAAADKTLEGLQPDVMVIGGGVIGCAITRELMRYQLDVLLVEKEHDVATHASGRNDGMVHPGADLHKGLLKKTYNDRGNRMYPQLCKELGVPFRYSGQYICFTSKRARIVGMVSLLYWKLKKVPAEYLSRKKLLKREPYVGENVSCALGFPKTGLVCPYGLTIALVENAAANGARVSLDTAVTGMEVANGKITSVLTNRGRVYPKLLINAAGVFSEDIAKMANDRYFSIHPRKGTVMIFDKKSAFNVSSVVASLDLAANKATHSKGGCILCTVDGNVLAGPDAVETYERENFATNRESVKAILAKHNKAIPGISERDIITYFTGVRAPTYEEDFYIAPGKSTKNIIHAAGIQSPGLTAAPAIAADVAQWAAEYLNAGLNGNFNPIRQPIVRAAELPEPERDALIKKDPEYGIIVCRCEEVSRGEVRDSLRRSVPCDTIDGVKRRVRPGMGRCQGGFCSPLVAQIIAEELGIPVEAVKKGPHDSPILLGDNKVTV